VLVVVLELVSSHHLCVLNCSEYIVFLINVRSLMFKYMLVVFDLGLRRTIRFIDMTDY